MESGLDLSQAGLCWGLSKSQAPTARSKSLHLVLEKLYELSRGGPGCRCVVARGGGAVPRRAYCRTRAQLSVHRALKNMVAIIDKKKGVHVLYINDSKLRIRTSLASCRMAVPRSV